MLKFIGRNEEFCELSRIANLNKSALIVCSGRRRIGKSTLIEQFASKLPYFIEIQGLAPRKHQTNKDQLDHFSKEYVRQTKSPNMRFQDWADAFMALGEYSQDKHILIFLDEISWMGAFDPDFAGKLKISWDTQLKKNKQLRLVLCGSVSSWIEKNILHSKDFIGRISLELRVQELLLSECHQFWGSRKQYVSSLEKFRILSLTGGVPRYLEEINFKKSAEQNIKELCFNKNSFLYSEFNKIFNDIFERRASLYKSLVRYLVEGSKTFKEVCKNFKTEPNGATSKYLKDLELSGFIRREYSWDLQTKKKKTNISKFRLSDNYLRFYLKYIEPNSDKIEKNLFQLKSIENLPEYESIMGFQFENLVLNNLSEIIKNLKINLSSIINAGPYIQTKTNRQQACQIDLLIQTKSTLYVCEIKFRKKIDSSVTGEVQDKIKKLKFRKGLSVRPVLIYVGELDSRIHDQDYFDLILDFSKILGED